MPGRGRLRRTLVSTSLPISERTWFIGFGPSAGEVRGIRRLCDKTLSHCYCFAQVGPFVQIINPGQDALEIGIKAQDDGSELDAVEYAGQRYQAGDIVLEYTSVPETMKWRSVWTPTCVSLVKAVIGYNSFSITPKQLMRALLKDGADYAGFGVR